VKAHVTLTSNITLHTKCYNLKKSNIMLSDPLHQHQTKKAQWLTSVNITPYHFTTLNESCVAVSITTI